MSELTEEEIQAMLNEPPRPTTPPVRGGFLIVLTILAAMAGVVYGGPYILWRIGYAYESGRAKAALEALKTLPGDDFSRASALFRIAQQAVAPAVANIRTISTGQGLAEGPAAMQSSGMGSGVVIDSAKGYIVTNHHVIKNADLVYVRIGSSGEIPAMIVGADPKTDLAVLKVGAKLTVEAAWGDSEKAEIGDWVLAIGSPFALERTVTAGIISAKNRTNLGLVEGNSFEDFLQTDAPINPGNSGGPLVNLKGEVIGINTAIFSENGGNQGIGLSIPSHLAQRIVNQIIKDGKVTRGFFGIRLQSLSESLAREFGVASGKGALVSSVVPGSPAAQAGLLSGDVITSMDGKPVEDSAKLRVQISALEVGRSVDVEYLRDGKTGLAKVTVGNLGNEVPMPLEALGFSVRDVKSDEARADSPSILLIDQVDRRSPADLAGLRPGMRVISVGPEQVNNREDFNLAVMKYDAMNGIPLSLGGPGGQRVTVVVRRGP
ncbi:MAG: trypsin-like peptidase domain-containing protein [bacterium]